jgi:hypothetical protein
MAHDHQDFIAALDRYGADLAAWPDHADAASARRLALADRRFRAHLDSAIAVEKRLAEVRDAMDREIAATGAAERVRAAVLAAIPRRRLQARRWAAVAAAVVVAAALGAVADVAILAPAGSESFEVVVLDPLAFDPTGTLSP